MSTKWFIGIDPGWDGGIACVDIDGNLVDAHGFTRKDSEARIVLNTYEFIEARPLCKIAIEKVSGRPGNGIVQAFNFGWHYGLMRGVSLIYVEEITDVQPASWQRALGCLSGGDKGVLVDHAKLLWPTQEFTKTGRRGHADACLIAEWLRRDSFQGKLF